MFSKDTIKANCIQTDSKWEWVGGWGGGVAVQMDFVVACFQEVALVIARHLWFRAHMQFDLSPRGDFYLSGQINVA